MKPRFSILKLLGFTAFVAIHFAAYAEPQSYWPEAALGIYFFMNSYLIAVACGNTNCASVFARGFLLGELFYQHYFYQTFNLEGRNFLFNWFTIDSWQSFLMGDKHELWERASGLLLGLLCGSVSLWHYRRQERKAQKS